MQSFTARSNPALEAEILLKHQQDPKLILEFESLPGQITRIKVTGRMSFKGEARLHKTIFELQKIKEIMECYIRQ